MAGYISPAPSQSSLPPWPHSGGNKASPMDTLLNQVHAVHAQLLEENARLHKSLQVNGNLKKELPRRLTVQQPSLKTQASSTSTVSVQSKTATRNITHMTSFSTLAGCFEDMETTATSAAGLTGAGGLVLDWDDQRRYRRNAEVNVSIPRNSGPGRTSLQSQYEKMRRAARYDWFSSARHKDLVINPDISICLGYWDLLTASCLIWVSIVAPVQLSLTDFAFDALFGINSLVDFVFLVDIFLQFFIMYHKPRDYGYCLETNHVKIVKRYLATWFIIDFLAIVPFDLVGAFAKNDVFQQYRSARAIRLFRLLKMIRVLKASRVLRRLEARTSLTYATQALIKFFVFLALLTHWMATLWAFALRLEEGSGEPRWIDGRKGDTAAKIYTQALYFTTYTITSVGYGDISPKNMTETLVCITMLIISGVTWAVVLGEVSATIANMSPDERDFRSTMDELSNLMQDRHFKRGMRYRLRNFFLSRKNVQRRERQERIIACMSPGLKAEIVMDRNKVWMSKVSLLKKVWLVALTSPIGAYYYACLVEVAHCLRVSLHAQGEFLGIKNMLHIMTRGVVVRCFSLRTGSKLSCIGGDRVLVAGDVWGTDFLLADVVLQERYHAHSLTFVETLTLQRCDMLSVVDKHAPSCPGLEREIRQHCCWLAFQRAFMKEARRRQRQLQRNPASNRTKDFSDRMMSEGADQRTNQDFWDPSEFVESAIDVTTAPSKRL